MAEARAAEGELHEAYGLLDAIFERAPVGLALYDRELRYVRINDRMAEINGVPPAEHIGRTVAEVVPEVADVEADIRRVLASGEPLTEIEVAGATAAAPGVDREWVVSYWPVRRRGDDESSASARSCSRSPSGAPPSARCASRRRATSRCCSRSPRSARG